MALVEVVAVERVIDLEPERVAGAQPRGDRAGYQQLLPQGRGLIRANEQLDAILARVAGPADEGVAGPDVQVGRMEALGELPWAIDPTTSRAFGPWTASIAKSSRRSCTSASKPSACSRNQARSLAWFEALVTVR